MGLFQQWFDVAAETEFEQTDRKAVVARGRAILVLKAEGRYHAVDNLCTHDHVQLTAGMLEGHEIECPLHGARFDIRTGTNLTPPAVRPLEVYATKVENGRVWVKV